MYFTVKVTTIYHCSLERAFKSPMLCDVSKVHTGYGIMPKVSHSTEDSNWGKPGSTKKIHVEKSLFQKGGFTSMDKIIERKENQFWIIQVDNFQSWMLGFYKFVGKWETKSVGDQKTQIDYTYQLHCKNLVFYPFCWIFAHLFWKRYMEQVIENIRRMTLDKEPYQFE